MTTYTITQAQLDACSHCAVIVQNLYISLKPNSQEPVGYQFQDREGKWCGFDSEKHLADTRAYGFCPIRAIYTHPAPISKEPTVLKEGECWPEEVMLEWDYWRKEIANGFVGSAPRDWFENLAEERLIDSRHISKEDAVKVLAALEAVDDLINHQFTGTREGMNDLQYACDGAREAMTIMQRIEGEMK